MILHICCNLAGSTVFPQLFEALKDAGLEQVVFVPEKRAEDLDKNEPKGIKTIRALTVKKSDALFFFRKAQRSVPEIEKQVELSRVTLIHAHTLFSDGSIARALYKKHGMPYVVTLRYSDMEAIWRYEPHLRPMARAILRDAKRVVFLSSAARDKVLGWFKGEARALIEKKTAIVPNGIKPEWLTGEARTAPADPVRVGFAGRLNDRKRPLDVLEAVHRASSAGKTRFVLRTCGSGPLEDKLKAGLLEGDAYVGAVRGMDAMKAFYADCDLLLVPSGAETFGMVYLEAMSQGLPVLYTKGQGFDGQFPEGTAGYAVPCGDVAAQAEALCRVAEHYAAMSREAVNRAKQFAWPLVAKTWKDLYEA